MERREPWPDLAGRVVGGTHVLPVRVYFEDTDFSGSVYHASYLRFMERGRSDLLRLAGIGHDALHKGAHGERLSFAVRTMTIDFLGPAHIDDLVEVHTRVAKATGARIVLAQSVDRGGRTLTRAEVTVVLVSGAGVPRRLPAGLARRLAAVAAA